MRPIGRTIRWRDGYRATPQPSVPLGITLLVALSMAALAHRNSLDNISATFNLILFACAFCFRDLGVGGEHGSHEQQSRGHCKFCKYVHELSRDGNACIQP